MLKENEVAKIIVDVAYQIHRQLGPGLLESVYQAVMKYELEKRGLESFGQRAHSGRLGRCSSRQAPLKQT